MEEEPQTTRAAQHASPLVGTLEGEYAACGAEANRVTDPSTAPSGQSLSDSPGTCRPPQAAEPAHSVDSTLNLLQDVLWNVLVHIRGHGTFESCYNLAKQRYEAHYPFLVSVERIFKTLANYPAEILSAMYIPVILSFFKWCSSVRQLPPEFKGSRFLITTKKGIAFLMTNLSEYSYNAATLYQAFRALKLLQSLEIALFPQKPALYHDPEDEEADDPNWKALDDSQLEVLISSVTKGGFRISGSVPPQPEPTNANILEGSDLSHAGQSSNVSAPFTVAQQPHQQPAFYGAVQQPPFSGAIPMPQDPYAPLFSGHGNDSFMYQNPEMLFSHTIPSIFQRMNALESANQGLSRENESLSQSLNDLQSELQSFKRIIDTAIPGVQTLASPRATQSRYPSPTPPHILLSSSNAIDTSDIAASVQKLDTDLCNSSVTQAQPLVPNYESIVSYAGAPGFIPDTELKSLERLKQEDTLVSLSGTAGSITTPPSGIFLTQAELQSPAKRPKHRNRRTEGAKLSKGETYQPPLAPNGKNYLLDDEGRLAIVMATEQGSVYGVYNEYYQSLRPQVDSYADDFGKKSMGHFRKKRTFQKKKAFVQWVERISQLNKMPPELVLDIVDEVRLKEKKSVVWACNNLGRFRLVLNRYKPDLKDTALSDVE
ncbi:LAQU0S06e00254g1_1 [Lachancea quebecensis]|uniref:LAQU0S06e00254g1_1 n=1 Tax=Lachancea quebecensis TaxID=1654605 RepID=A0A0P1KS35_9SACH|nr:LAQU0S06e00254g1_1 [Lachancea quebecensis]